MDCMDAAQLRAFALRDRRAVDAAKLRYWTDRYRDRGWADTWRRAQELYAYARRVRPDFPTARDRDQDFADHLELKRRLDQASHVLAGR
jgi:hypothetical protein